MARKWNVPFRETQALPLHEALRHERLVIVGDPGAGKTTFLRRVAHALCQTELGDAPDAALARVGISERTFPILVRLNELDEHISRHRNDPAAPTGEVAGLAAALPGEDQPGQQTGGSMMPFSASSWKTAVAPCCWMAWTRRRIVLPASDSRG